jgi:apolipoprotein N-acyltransferase
MFGTNYVIISNNSDTTEKKNFTLLSGLTWIFTLVWACLGVGWIQNAISCNTDIIKSANIVLTILFVNFGIVIVLFVIGFLYTCCLFLLFKR